MESNHINQLFEALTPNENQKTKMWNAIQQKRTSATRSSRVGMTSFRKRLVSISACLLVFLLSATAYAAVTDQFDWYHKIFNGKGQSVGFANGDTLHYEINGNHTSVRGGGEGKGPWVVKESWGRLIVSVNGEKINITNSLKEKGYFYYNYRDEANILHRLYIVKNAGGIKDYAERWYSQMEWLPELGMSGGLRGISSPLADVIMSAEIDYEEGKDLDAALKEHLAIYWSEYGE